MNYAANRANVVPVSNDTPAALSNLKNTVLGRTKYDTPFFLMPVRMETRFMKVMRNILYEVAVMNTGTVSTGIKGTLTNIDKATVYTGFTSATAFRAADELRLSMAQFSEGMKDIESLQPIERAELSRQAQELTQQLPAALQRLTQAVTDPEMSEMLQGSIVPKINDTLESFNKQLQDLPEDNSWQDDVSEDGKQLVEQVKKTVDQTLPLLESMFDGSGIDDKKLQDFIGYIDKLLPSFTDPDRKYSAADRQKVLQYMPELQDVMATVDQLMGEAATTGGLQDQQSADMYALKIRLNNSWDDFMMQGLGSAVWLAQPGGELKTLTQEEIDLLPENIKSTGIEMQDRQAFAAQLIEQLSQQDGGFDPQLSAQFIDCVSVLRNLVSGLEILTDDDQRSYLWQPLQPFNDMITRLADMIEAFRATGQEVANEQADKLRLAAYRLAASWSSISSTASVLGNIPNATVPLTDDEYSSLPDSLRNTGSKINDEAGVATEQANNILDLDSLPDEGMFYTFSDHIGQVAKLLTQIQGDVTVNVQQRYLFQVTNPAVTVAASVKGHILSFQDKDPGKVSDFVGRLNEATTALTNAWGGVVKTGTLSGGTATLFSPWREVDELWIRVYPDDIFIHSHEEALTQAEYDSGVAYWNEWWAAHGDTDKQLAAWRALVALYGPQRAAWIIKALTPTNFASTAVIGTTTATMANIGVLGSYTAQLQAVSMNDTQLVAMPDFLSHYTPQINFLSSSVRKVEAMPADFAQATRETLSSVRDGFDQLSNTLTERGIDTIGETVFAIRSQFDQLTEAVHSVRVVDSWDAIYNQPPHFPSVTIKDENWTAPAKTYALPDRFVFAAINEDKTSDTYSFRHIKVGLDIPASLQVGMDPANTDFNIDAYNNLILDPNLKWMFDFNEAVAKGMGIIMRLTAAEAQNGFDRLLALGLKLNDTISSVPGGYSSLEDYARKNGKQLLEKLIDNHHYTAEGMSMLTLGTPTNNTDGVSAGFNQRDENAELSFSVEAQNALFGFTGSKLDKKDGQWLADALGINYSVLQHIENAGRQQISGAIAMNRALWPATIGNFMSDMLTRMFTLDNIQRTKTYFTDYVLGRNTLPPVRIGNQPYGILPTTAFTRWNWKKKYSGTAYNSEGRYDEAYYKSKLGANAPAFFEDRFNERLLQVFTTLNNTWMQMVNKFVKTVDKNSGSANAQKDFMEILGADALMSEAYSRFMLNASTFQNIGSYYTPGGSSWAPPKINVPGKIVNLFNYFNLSGTATGPTFSILDDNHFADLVAYGSTNNIADGLMKALPILNMEILKADSATGSPGQYKLNGPTVDEKVLSEFDAITPIAGLNYIQWLLNANPKDIWNNNVFGTMQSRSLLFLLMRQSLLTTYRDTCWDTLEKTGVFSKAARNAVGIPNGIAAQVLNSQDQFVLTKWHILFNSIGTLATTPSLKLNNALAYFTENPVWWPSGATIPSVVTGSASDPAYRNIKIGDFLKTPSSFTSQPGYSVLNSNTDWSKLDTVRDAFSHLKFLPTADLDRMLREHIDLCTNRLDAWNSGMVNKRLWEHRNVENGVRKTGIYLGAYSWLIDIRPKNFGGMKKITSTHLPAHLAESSDTVYYDKTNLGFIHTPSVAHSLTASILRSGFVSEQKSADNRFAVNLTSERVKIALSMLEGIRNGQTMNAMLGYMFERQLHEGYPVTLPLDQYIYDFRRQFPLAGIVPTATLAEQVRPNNVVDGIELLHTFRNSVSAYLEAFPDKSIYEIYTTPSLTVAGQSMASHHPFGFTNMPANGTAACTAIMKEIDRIANAADATGDLAIAEGVFQVAKGNFGRSAAVMQSLTEGKNPADPEIIDTPLTGTNISHRLVTMVAPQTSAVSPWTGVPLTQRAIAEPTVNQWVADMLASAFGTTVLSSAADFASYVDTTVAFKDFNGADQTFTMTLKQLQVQPVDLIYFVHAGDYKEEMTKRIAQYARAHVTNYKTGYSGIPKDVQVTVQLKSKGAGMIASFWELLALINATAGVVTNSRYLRSDDFLQTPNPAVNTANPLYNVADIQARATAAVNDFGTNVKDYFNLPTGMPAVIANDTDLNNLRIKLSLAARYGIDFALPEAVSETFVNTTNIADVAADMRNQGLRVKVEAVKRHAAATTFITAAGAATDEDVKVKAYADALNAIFGNGFKALPHFSFDHYTGLKTGIDDQLTLNTTSTTAGIMRQYQPTDVATAMEDWLYGLARVQEKMADVETLRMMVATGNSSPLQTIRPVQFPYVAASASTTEDYWLGLPYPATYEPEGDKTSVAIFNYGALAAGGYGYYAGVVIDEWNEMIPAKEIMSGIGFNYDQPNAKPPQTVLLAVSPNTSGTWSLDDLWYTLIDTMEMSKVRMVEPDHFRAIAGDSSTEHFEIFKWLLPAVVGEVTPHVVTEQPAGTFNHIRYQSTDSIQQVSFEYNPVNDPVPVPGGVNSGILNPVAHQYANNIAVGIDWDRLDADNLIGSQDLQTFSAAQYTLANIAVTQGAMASMQSASMYSYYDQQNAQD